VATHSSTRSSSFNEVAPEKIAVPLDGLLAHLPAEFCTQKPETSSGRMLELPCAELFHGNTPRLRLGVLRELLPDWVRLPEETDPQQSVILPAGWLALYFQLITRRGHPHGTSEPNISPSMVEARAAKSGVMPSSRTPLPSEPAPVSTPAETGEKKQGFFASLPIFKRQESESVIVGASEPVQEKQLVPEHALTLEPLWKLDSADRLADSTALQSLFMTEEKLTLERVISLAGTLPGLRACVLTHGDRVVCASNTPAGIDLRTLSTQATAMLSQIRESSSLMGLGAVPAITLHCEQGTLSFLHQGELCLLVLHADRGFVPGVCERLQEMLTHLDTAKALPN